MNSSASRSIGPRRHGIRGAAAARLRWARRLVRDVEAVIAQYPEADPEDVRLTLICLQAPPLA